MPTIQESLKELIVDRLFLDIDPDEIDTDTPLAEYGVDSFLLLELIVALEELYGIKFEESDITSETLKSVASLTELIQSKQAGGTG